jgi:hypothetical protein
LAAATITALAAGDVVVLIGTWSSEESASFMTHVSHYYQFSLFCTTRYIRHNINTTASLRSPKYLIIKNNIVISNDTTLLTAITTASLR